MIACAECRMKESDCEFPTYRKNIASAVSYFITAVNERNSYYLKAIIQPQNSGMFNSTIKISSKYKENGFDVLTTGPFCFHE